MGSPSPGNFLEEAIIDQGQEGIVGMGEHSRWIRLSRGQS